MKPKVFKTRAVSARKIEELNFSQGKVDGFDLETNQDSSVLLIGCGALGSHVAQGLIRKGVGQISLCDDDRVELKNLTRQLFHVRDCGKNKAVALGSGMRREGFFRTIIHAYPYRFQELLEAGVPLSSLSLLVVLVDNNQSRVDGALFGILYGVPVIHVAVSRDGGQMYCAVQEPGKACIGCMLPQVINDHSYPCNLPGIIDVIQVAAGFVVYAADTILCGRYRDWNFRSIRLDGSMPDAAKTISRNLNCPLCGKDGIGSDPSKLKEGTVS